MGGIKRLYSSRVEGDQVVRELLAEFTMEGDQMITTWHSAPVRAWLERDGIVTTAGVVFPRAMGALSVPEILATL